jgi:1,4-dihydroxy-6-naphthoate synthase
MFHAIIHQKIDLLGLKFRIRYLDVQELNELTRANQLDCSKVSFHAAIHVADRYGILRSGAALGDGVGPIVVSKQLGLTPSTTTTICCPGASTTAMLLFQLAYPESTLIEHRVFSDIMPAVVAGEVQFGVVIHEGRFTYEEQGLHLTTDLGDHWKKRTSAPVPLGGIVASLALPDEVHARLRAVIRSSIEYAQENRQETLPTMRQHAQELTDEAIWPHVDLYVNEFSLDLGEVGVDALRQLDRLSRECGVVPSSDPTLRILG